MTTENEKQEHWKHPISDQHLLMSGFIQVESSPLASFVR